MAPLLLVSCKLVPQSSKVDSKILAAIFSNIADVFRKSNNINAGTERKKKRIQWYLLIYVDTLAHLCTALVILIRKVETSSGTWREAELMRGNEV